MNDQEAFNQVWDWFVVQKKPQSRSHTDGGTCAYRGAGGAKCAVGVLVPNELYLYAIEGMSAGRLIGFSTIDYLSEDNQRAVKRIRSHLSGLSPGLLSDMQYLHDNHAADIDPAFDVYMEAGLRLLAKRYHLEAPT